MATFKKILHHSASETTTSTGIIVVHLHTPKWVVCELHLTAASGTSLDVFLQTRIDDTQWIDVIHFTQFIGSATEKSLVSTLKGDLDEAEYATSTTLAVGTVRNTLGADYRARWDVVSGDFTFSVEANFGFD